MLRMWMEGPSTIASSLRSLCGGPFKAIYGFHGELRDGVEGEAQYKNVPLDLRELVSFHKQPWQKSVFTHGDLSSLNGLARGVEVVGIIDWETTGWVPPYWEYVSAWQFWQQEVNEFLSPMPVWTMGCIRRKYFGDF